MSAPGVQLTVGALCQLDDALLMVRRGTGPAGGHWDVPRAPVERGEAVAESVVRTCKEQARTETLCGPFVGWDEHPGAEPPTVDLYFDVVLLDAVHATAPSPGPTNAEARFVPVHEIAELRLAAGLAEFLADNGVIDTVV